MHTGIANGNVAVHIEIHDHEPPLDDADWEEVAEASMQVEEGALMVRFLMEDPPDLPVLTPAGPGPYRVRAHARGPDIAYDGCESRSQEVHLFQIWSALYLPLHVLSETVGPDSSPSKIIAVMPFLVCAHCAQGLTIEIEQTTVPAQDVPGRPYLPASAYKPSWDGGFVVNRHDVTGAIRHPDPSRSAGCCGPHGLDGPNLVCSGCGREVGTEESDCWKPHFVVTLPTATALVPEFPEAPK